MARARNIKPAFFDNDELAENAPIGRLLFIGLWTLADYQGNLEWREKRIKAKVLPYDNCDIKKLAINLDKSGFIRFYSDGDEIYCNIVNFTKHQNPHKNERDKGSTIPEFSEDMRQAVDLKGLTINRDKSGLIPEGSHSDRADSLNLIPDSLNPIYTLASQADECLEHLNLVTGRSFKSSSELEARLKEFSVEEVKKVIEYKAKEWMGSEWQKYLRPKTLFNKTKFEGYLNDAAQYVPIQKEEAQVTLGDLTDEEIANGDFSRMGL